MSQNIYTTNYLGQTFFSSVNNDTGNLFANSSFATVNFNATVDSVRAKKEVVYERPTIIKTSDIVATIDGSPNNGEQLYTFGPYQQPHWLAQCYTLTGNTFVYSRDGLNWTGLSNSVFGYGTGYHSHCWNGWIWVAGANITNSLAYSFDGITWTGLGTTIFSSLCKYVEWNGQMFLAVGIGTGNYLAYSYDGINWIGLGLTAFAVTSYIGECSWNGQIWLVCGSNTGSRHAYSYDGITWSGLTSNLFSLYGWSLSWNGHAWLIGGCSSTVNHLAYSRNSVPTVTTDWTLFPSPANATSQHVYDLGWGGPAPGQWVIGMNSPTTTLASSDDPTGFTNWYNLKSSIFLTQAGAQGQGWGPYWNGSMWLMSASAGFASTITAVLATSYNGKTWYPQDRTAIFSPTAGAGGGRPGFNSRRQHTIRFAMNRVVTVGTGGNSILISSSDLNGWIQPLYRSPFRTAAYAVKFNGTVWIAGGALVGTISTGNTLAYSYDAIRWYGLGSLVFTNDVYGLEWNGKTWLAGGSGGNTIGFSQDGLSWQCVPLNRSPFTARTRTFAYDGVKWLAGGEGGNTLAYTLDPYGKSGWIGLGTSIFASVCHMVKWNGQMWISVGAGGNRLAYSYDGLSWSSSPSANTLFNNECRAVDWNGQMWLATGGFNYTTAYSYDGIVWLGGITPSLSGMLNGTCIKWCGSKWFMTGAPVLTTGNSIMSSNDGITNWIGNAAPTGFTSFGQSIEWSGGKGAVYIQHPVVAGGAIPGNTLSYSPDGIQWYGLGASVFARSCNGILWNGDKWVATGHPGNVFAGQKGNTLAYSYDGYQWTGLGSNIFTNYGCKLGWNGQIWIATGTGGNSLAYSRDGLNWTGLGTTVFTLGTGVAWNGLSWMASGTGGNALAYSSDGITWTGVTGSVALLGIGSGILSNGSLWVATGNSGGSTCIAYSADLSGSIGWTAGTNATSIFPTTAPSGGNGIAMNGNVWVVAGQGSATLAYSYDGKTWTSAGSSQLTTNAKSVCWTGTRFVATGAGTNQMAYSKTGIVWYNPPRSANIMYQGNAICSNSPIGTVVVDSAMTLNNNLFPNSQTVEFVADAYYQTGYTNMRCTVASNNPYNTILYKSVNQYIINTSPSVTPVITGNTYVFTFNASVATKYYVDVLMPVNMTYLVVGGGGGGGTSVGAGGGGGGVLTATQIISSQLNITVGTGGAGMATASSTPANGLDSIISNKELGVITAYGGGGASGQSYSVGNPTYRGNGGCGAGQTRNQTSAAGTGVAGQGYGGGNFVSNGATVFCPGGGGGAGGVGGNGTYTTPSQSMGGVGGNGVQSNITGTNIYYGGGGGGQVEAYTSGGFTGIVSSGGLGGGGAGGANNNGTAWIAPVQGTDGLGGGGGGGANAASYLGARGGNGVVILKFTF